MIHPIPVQIRKADRKFTAIQDNVLKEPIGQMRRPQKPVDLVAQIKQQQRTVVGPGGAEETEDGFLLFLTKDLRAKHLTIERGDLVVRIGEGDNERETDMYITRSRWMGHYPNSKGPQLLKVFFMDRQPAQQKREA